MEWILLLIAFVVYVKLVSVQSLRFAQATMSRFERERRQAQGDDAALAEQFWLEVQPQVRGFFQLVSVLCIVVMIGLVQAVFGWLIGLSVAGILLLLVGPLTRVSVIHLLAHRSYSLIERYVKQLTAHARMGRFLRWFRYGEDVAQKEYGVGSRAELEFMLQHTHVVNARVRKMLLQAMVFPEIGVDAALTPRRNMVTVEKAEVLGPKRLDELHKTGEDFFLVVDRRTDKALGVLAAHSIMNTRRQDELTAEEMVEPVLRVEEAELLDTILGRFLREKRHLGIVVNKSKEITGVITIEAIIAQLLGTPPSRDGE